MKFAQIVLDLVNLSMASFVIVPPRRKDKLQTMKVDMDSFVSHTWQFGSPDVGVSSPVSKLKQPTRDLDTCIYSFTCIPAYPLATTVKVGFTGVIQLYSALCSTYRKPLPYILRTLMIVRPWCVYPWSTNEVASYSDTPTVIAMLAASCYSTSLERLVWLGRMWKN